MTQKEFIKTLGRFMIPATITFLPPILAVVTQQPAWLALYGVSGIIILYMLFK